MSEAEQYDDIRARVEKRFQKRSAFYTHVAVYTLVNIILWVIYGFTNSIAGHYVPVIGTFVPIAFFPWPLIIMAVWGIGLIAHGMNYYIRYGGGALRRREAMRREIERELALTGYEKPKNDTPMRLTDDGELEVIEDDAAWSMKRKHR